MSVEIIGHAIVSADGRIADRQRRMPPALRNDKDWTRFQAALDASVLVVLGRLGHEAHPNPGRRRLVVSGNVEGLRASDGVMRWNPADVDFAGVLERLGIADGAVAVTGGQAVFDLFLPLFTRFDLVTVAAVTIPDGVPCFSGGMPEIVLPGAGLRISESEALDPGVTLAVWRR